MKIANTVEELIIILNEFPKNKKIYSNEIRENLKGELILMHKPTDEEIEHIRRREKEREAEAERDRDMPTFGSRW